MADPTPAEAAAQQGGKRKPKAQKVSLDTFLTTGPGGGSWADEMENLPTGPANRPDGDDYSRSSRYNGGRHDRNDDRPSFDRPEVPLPTNPPFTAFIGNLAFDTAEGDLEEFFGGQATVSSVRIVRDHEGRPKGFGYVEFINLDGLKEALGSAGQSMAGRTIRVTVAEPPRQSSGSDRGGRGGYSDPNEGRSAGAWVRQGPLPPVEESRRSGFGSSRGPGDRDRDRDYTAPQDLDRWNSVRGAKFVPSDSEPPRRNASGLSTRYVSGGSSGATTPPTPHVGSDDGQPTARPEVSASWRRPSREGSLNAEKSPPSSGLPSPAATRRKLELAPRTVSPSSTASAPATPSLKPSPFGNAVPVNTKEREAAMEAKLQKEREERDAKEQEAKAQAAADKAAKANRVDPFGNAKPVDTTTKDREAEEKIARELAELKLKRSQAASPASPKAGANGHSTSRRSSMVKDAESPKDKDAQKEPPAAPTKIIITNPALRKEGISYSNIATSASTTNGAVKPEVKVITEDTSASPITA